MFRRWLLLAIATLAALATACSSGGGGGGGGASDKGAPIPTGQQPAGGTGQARITFDLQGRQARISDTAVTILINVLDPVTQTPLAQPVSVPVDRSGATQTVTITVPVGDVLLLVETLDANGNVLDVGSAVITVAEGAVVSASITLRPFDQTVVGVPSELVFVTQPSTAGQNTAIAPPVQVAVQDGNGRLIASATDAITLALANNPTGAVLGGTVTVNAVDGVATFSDLRVNNPGVGYTLIAASTGRNSDISAGFDIAAVPASLAVTVPPTNTPQLSAITPAVQVSVLDQNGVVVPGATNPVTVSLASGAGTLSGTLTVNAVDGVATFSDLSIDQVGTGFTLAFTSPGLAGVTSSSFDTTNAPGVPTQIAFLVQPGDTDINQTIAPAVQVVIQDFQGATVAGASNPVTLTLATNPPGASLNGTLTVNAVNGVAVFDNLSVDNAGTGFVLGASSPGLTGASSSAFNIRAVVGPPIAFFGSQDFINIDTSGNRRFAAPINPAAADFNGDGRLDFVTGDGINTGNPTVHLNTSATGTLIPTFASFGIPASNSGAFFVGVADINTDGRPDILTNPGITNLGVQSFQVLLNTTPTGAATPSFSAPSNFAASTGALGGFRNIAVADLNDDGREDLVFGYSFGAGWSARINTTPSGAVVPSFGAPTDFTAGSAEGIATLGDLNGDGRPDLVLGGNGALFAAANTTNPNDPVASFDPAVEFVPTGGGTVDWPSLGDFDGDGLLDVVTADRAANRVRLWRNLTPLLGTPVFVQNSLIDTGFFPQFTAVADFNNDGRADVAATNGWNSITLPVNKNSLSVLINQNLSGVIAFQPIDNFPTTDGPFGIAPGDFNNDGVVDAAVASGATFGYMTTMLIGTTPAGATSASFSLGNYLQAGNGPSAVAHADFNTDGQEDLVVANFTDATFGATVYLNSGGGAFAPTGFATGTRPTAVVIADFNTDGRDDAMTVNSLSSDVTFMINTTASGAGTPTFSLGSLAVGATPQRATVADFNRDGLPDFAVACTGGNNTRVFINQTPSGAGTATFDPTPLSLTTNTPGDVVSGDFSGDGIVDMALVANGTIEVYTNTTTAGAAQASFTGPFVVDSFQTNHLAVGDVNADGLPDLVNPAVNVYFNTTTGGALAFTRSTTIGSVSTFIGNTPFLVVQDANGDGLPEIFLGDAPGNDVAFLRNTTAVGSTTASFDNPLYYVAGDYRNLNPNLVFGGLTVADLTGDGRADMAVATPGTSCFDPAILGSVQILPQQ